MVGRGCFRPLQTQLFQERVPLPGNDPFGGYVHRFFSLLKPDILETEFRKWVRSVIEKYEGVIALDYKTIKGTRYDATASCVTRVCAMAAPGISPIS